MNLRNKLSISYTWHIFMLDIMKSLKQDILDNKKESSIPTTKLKNR